MGLCVLAWSLTLPTLSQPGTSLCNLFILSLIFSLLTWKHFSNIEKETWKQLKGILVISHIHVGNHQQRTLGASLMIPDIIPTMHTSHFYFYLFFSFIFIIYHIYLFISLIFFFSFRVTVGVCITRMCTN